MNQKMFLLKILFLFLTLTLTNCTADNLEDEIQEQISPDKFDKYLIDKDDIEEPDDRK